MMTGDDEDTVNLSKWLLNRDMTIDNQILAELESDKNKL